MKDTAFFIFEAFCNFFFDAGWGKVFPIEAISYLLKGREAKVRYSSMYHSQIVGQLVETLDQIADKSYLFWFKYTRCVVLYIA